MINMILQTRLNFYSKDRVLFKLLLAIGQNIPPWLFCAQINLIKKIS